MGIKWDLVRIQPPIGGIAPPSTVAKWMNKNHPIYKRIGGC